MALLIAVALLPESHAARAAGAHKTQIGWVSD